MIRPVRPPGSRRANDDLLPIRVGARAMKTAIFSTKEYDRQFFDAANKGHRHELTYHTESLHRTTAGMAGRLPAGFALLNHQPGGSAPSGLSSRGPQLLSVSSPRLHKIHPSPP